MSTQKEKLLEVKGLKTYFRVGGQIAKAVDGIDFDIFKGEVLGIVGESGSGKSVSVLSLIQLIPNPPGEVVDGKIIFNGEMIFDGDELKKVREVPEYLFFPNLSEDKRNLAAAAFFIIWMAIYLALPISNPLFFFISLFLDLAVVAYLFYNSPQKKVLRDFRDKMYRRMREIRGREIAMIFQEPMTSLNPVYTVGMQIIESLYAKSLFDFVRDGIISNSINIRNLSWKNRLKVCLAFGLFFLFGAELIAGWKIRIVYMLVSFLIGFFVPVLFALTIKGFDLLIPNEYREKTERLFNEGAKLLDQVGIPDPHARLHDYPHQFSGGMRQRAMIAMALAKNPSLLIADEPTTALDVTIQAQILELMNEVKNRRKEAAIVLITHDLAVVAETCERVIVMYGGKIQEVATALEIFDNPKHPYTRGLLNSIPKPEQNKRERLSAIRGMVPNILNLPEGCKFCTRCDEKLAICDTIEPELIEIGPDHFVRCHLYR